MSAPVSKESSRLANKPALVPVLPARGIIDPALDRVVSDLVRTNLPLTPDLRNALFAAYAPRLNRILLRLWYRNLSVFGCELEDLQQELFLVFDALVARWPGAGSLSAYLHGAVPWRLFDAARRMAPRDRPIGDREIACKGVDLSQTDAEMVLLLEEMALRLSRFESDLLLMHVRDGKSLAKIAIERGMNPRTVRRAWLRLQQRLRSDLAW